MTVIIFKVTDPYLALNTLSFTEAVMSLYHQELADFKIVATATISMFLSLEYNEFVNGVSIKRNAEKCIALDKHHENRLPREGEQSWKWSVIPKAVNFRKSLFNVECKKLLMSVRVSKGAAVKWTAEMFKKKKFCAFCT